MFTVSLKENKIFLVILFLIFFIYLWLAWQPIEKLLSAFLVDDAFYYFKPALNLAGGLGPTFDGEHLTNGYHPLWMGIVAVVYYFFPDDKILRPDQESSRRILSDQIREVLNELNPKERKILEMRYGLLDGIQHTLERVGEEFGVTRERIRQIEAKVHEKLRQNEKISRLKNYFD